MNNQNLRKNNENALTQNADNNNRFNFTVKDLQKILAELPQDLPVLVSGYESGYENFYAPNILKLKHYPQNMYFEGEFQLAEDKDTDIFNAVVLERVVRSD
jgi:hypothetical protein